VQRAKDRSAVGRSRRWRYEVPVERVGRVLLRDVGGTGRDTRLGVVSSEMVIGWSCKLSAQVSDVESTSRGTVHIAEHPCCERELGWC